MLMKELVENGLDVCFQDEVTIFKDRRQPLTFENCCLTHLWTLHKAYLVMYTESELQRIHRVFGHPSVSGTHGLLKSALGGMLDKDTTDSVEGIAQHSQICKENAGPPRRFKLTVGCCNHKFIKCVRVDTMFLIGVPVIHMVHFVTQFFADYSLKHLMAEDIWKAMQIVWILVHLGPPDHLMGYQFMVYQGSNNISREFKGNLEAADVTLHEVPIDGPNSIGTQERYQSTLRAAFTNIRSNMDRDTTDAECLQLACFVVNATVGP